jgi:hypothetical protein
MFPLTCGNKVSLKIENLSQVLVLTPVILVTQEAKIRRIKFNQPG